VPCGPHWTRERETNLETTIFPIPCLKRRQTIDTRRSIANETGAYYRRDYSGRVLSDLHQSWPTLGREYSRSSTIDL
jgi:hypothetical protein